MSDGAAPVRAEPVEALRQAQGERSLVIGFIGVGLMGHGMAKNIVEKGYPLVVMGHRNRAPVEQLVSLGASEATTARELAAQCDIVHLCVTGSPQVEALLRGPDGVMASGKKGLIVIDCSTSNPVSTLALGDELKAAGMTFVDAPLSRTPKEAQAGTLDTMIGADADTFARIKPVIECWATTIKHLGPLGLGHKMKLVNNFVAMGYAALYAEALAIARRSGLSSKPASRTASRRWKRPVTARSTCRCWPISSRI